MTKKTSKIPGNPLIWAVIALVIIFATGNSGTVAGLAAGLWLGLTIMYDFGNSKNKS